MAAPAAKKARVDPTASPFTVMFPGEEGALAHSAATRFFSSSPNADLKGVATFADAVAGVKDGKALYAVLPIENSASGSIPQTYDLLGEHDVKIGAELGLRENFQVCAKQGVTLESVKRLLSHPSIIESCSTFIEKKLPGVELVPVNNTTVAAKRVADDATKVCAAIATREAAKRNNLAILASDVGDYKHQETRYILIHRSTGPVAELPAPFPRDAVSPIRKQSAAFVVSDTPNALCKLLTCFAHRNLNVLKVETRPLKGHKAPTDRPVGNLWDMLVFVDYAVPPGQSTEQQDRLMSNLAEYSVWSRDFGIYPSQVNRQIKKEQQGWGDMVDTWAK